MVQRKKIIIEETPPRSGRFSVIEWPTHKIIATDCTKEAAEKYAKEGEK